MKCWVKSRSVHLSLKSVNFLSVWRSLFSKGKYDLWKNVFQKNISFVNQGDVYVTDWGSGLKTTQWHKLFVPLDGLPKKELGYHWATTHYRIIAADFDGVYFGKQNHGQWLVCSVWRSAIFARWLNIRRSIDHVAILSNLPYFANC